MSQREVGPIVIKFGGTSVGSPSRVRRAAHRVAAHVRARRRVVVVVSAAGGATDRILDGAARVGAAATGREMDRALATGEDRSAALLALALGACGVPARSLRAAEAGLVADGPFGAGRLRRLRQGTLRTLLAEGVVPVVAGFQGVRADGETVTLGRGGSDVTAVFVAAALGACCCHIVTDVDAVYDADPRRDARAVRLPRLSHRALVALTRSGAEVVHPDAARLALRHAVPLRIYHHRAPLRSPGGTRVHHAGRATRPVPTEEAAVSSLPPAGRPARRPLDAYRTTGPSPTRRTRCVATVHLLGPGAVGRALLARLAEYGLRLVAVTDTSGSLLDPQGIDPVHVGAFKAAGGRVADLPGARALDIVDALEGGRADIVIDATTTQFDRPAWALDLERGALARGAGLALAAKDAVCRTADRWLAGPAATRVGVNAVLGGTGREFVAVLPALRGGCRSIALAGSASTTTILEAIEAGGTLADGLATARARGFLETDPELDLRGADAAIKLAIVAGAVLGRPVDPGTIPCTDLRQLDPRNVRDRAADGLTTRLVGRLRADGTLACSYEALPAGAPLAVPVGRVAYVYTLADGTDLVHGAGGLGADGTAVALLADVLALAGVAGTRRAGGRAHDAGARAAAVTAAGGER